MLFRNHCILLTKFKLSIIRILLQKYTDWRNRDLVFISCDKYRYFYSCGPHHLLIEVTWRGLETKPYGICLIKINECWSTCNKFIKELFIRWKKSLIRKYYVFEHWQKYLTHQVVWKKSWWLIMIQKFIIITKAPAWE